MPIREGLFRPQKIPREPATKEDRTKPSYYPREGADFEIVPDAAVYEDFEDGDDPNQA